jgi:hypothetical protein
MDQTHIVFDPDNSYTNCPIGTYTKNIVYREILTW